MRDLKMASCVLGLGLAGTLVWTFAAFADTGATGNGSGAGGGTSPDAGGAPDAGPAADAAPGDDGGSAEGGDGRPAGDGGAGDGGDAGTTNELVACGGYEVCFIAGAVATSFSLTDMAHDSTRAGSTAHKMVGLAMPMLGVRWVPKWAQFQSPGFFSLDALAYTGLIPSQSLDPAPANVKGCHANGNNFESLLPCEGNATLTPQIAFAFPAITVTPTPNISALTVGLTYGWARTVQDSAFDPFVGLLVTVGAAQLSYGLGTKESK